MTMTKPTQRSLQSDVARRVGYVIGAGVNAALLYIVNVQPGWERVPFLTDATIQVLWLVNLSIAVGLLANVVYAIADSWWVKDIGDIVTTTVGLVALIALWRVFPFDFSQSANDWSWLARLVLLVAVAGSALAIVIQVIKLLKDSVVHLTHEGEIS